MRPRALAHARWRAGKDGENRREDKKGGGIARRGVQKAFVIKRETSCRWGEWYNTRVVCGVKREDAREGGKQEDADIARAKGGPGGLQ
jgi:hypothetical protein